MLYWDGRGGTGLHANEVAPILAAEHGLRVLAPDPPGHGRSASLPPEAYRPSSLAALAAGLLDELGVARVAFVGFSVGADLGCAFTAAFPERVSLLVLVDGGHWDLADLSGFDVSASLETRIARVRDERYPSWEAYLAAEREALGRWSPALEEAHRATMRESDGSIVPIAGREVLGGIDWGNCVEPNVATYPALRASGVPVVLVVPAEHGPVAEAGLRRFREEVPQLVVRSLPTGVHDLVSHAPAEVAALVAEHAGAR